MEKNFYPKVKAYDISKLQQGSTTEDVVEIVNFKVQVNVDNLNIRSGPSTSYNIIGTAKKVQYTI